MASKSVAQIAASISRQYGALESQEDVSDVFAAGRSVPGIKYGAIVVGEVQDSDDLSIQVGTASEIAMENGVYPLADLYHWLAMVANDFYGREGTLTIAARWEPADGIVEESDVAVVEDGEEDDDDEE